MTTTLYINLNTRCTCIKAIFNKLFYYRRWALNHFTGGNLVG
jgi:hypothetical protein